ncbi:MAG: bifunctional DNA primase/polymerase [Tepidisphaeraceae bacterium]
MTDARERQARTSAGFGHVPPGVARYCDSGRTAVLVEAARQYMRRGFAVVPIAAGQKTPILADWQHTRLKEQELRSAFRRAGNVGLILGAMSRDLVDVDLDCEEARGLADQYLPPTSGNTGRPSSPRSHRWYFCPGIKTTRHQDPVTRGSMLELRGAGSQTLVGPSIHPSGEPYDRLDKEPAAVSAEVLTAAVRNIADEIIRRRHGAKSLEQKVRPEPMRAPVTATVDHAQAIKRATAYLRKMQPAISGQGGHGRTYAAATVLVHGFCLSEAEAFDLLKQEYNPRCDPPWTDHELEHKVADATSCPHTKPRGWLLDALTKQH